MEKEQIISKLNEEIRNCKKCKLWKTRNKAVPGEGPINANIMIIGQAPGATEDRKGRPFVGMAGEFLNKLLQSINLRREEIFITSSIKCFPPRNRQPQPEEIRACKPYLDKQLEIIKPRIIVALGNVALQTLLNKKLTVSQIHGKIQKKNDTIIFPTFHPAAAMRFPKIREEMEKDFEKLKELILSL